MLRRLRGGGIVLVGVGRRGGRGRCVRLARVCLRRGLRQNSIKDQCGCSGKDEPSEGAGCPWACPSHIRPLPPRPLHEELGWAETRTQIGLCDLRPICANRFESPLLRTVWVCNYGSRVPCSGTVARPGAPLCYVAAGFPVLHCAKMSNFMLPLKAPSAGLFISARDELRASACFSDAPYRNARLPSHYANARARIDRTTTYRDFNKTTFPSSPRGGLAATVPILNITGKSFHSALPDGRRSQFPAHSASARSTKGTDSATRVLSAQRPASARPVTQRQAVSVRPASAQESLAEEPPRGGSAPSGGNILSAQTAKSVNSRSVGYADPWGGALANRPINARLRRLHNRSRPLTLDTGRVGVGVNTLNSSNRLTVCACS